MTRPRLLADQDFSENILLGLQRRDPTAGLLRLREVGLKDVADGEVLEFAASNGLLIVSHDFKTMPAAAWARVHAGQQMCGVLVAHQLSPVAAIIEDLMLVLVASTAEEWHSQVRYLPF